METGDALKQDLADLYRFAMLLTGEGTRSQQVIREILLESSHELPQLRSERHRKAWLVAQIRKRVGEGKPAANADGNGATDSFPMYLAQLAEPVRSAMALFYLDFMTVRDIAQILKMSVEDLARLLAEGRRNLRETTGQAATA